MRPLAAPLWFHLLLTLAFTGAWRVCAPDAAAAPEVQLALFAWVVVLFQAVWTGIQIVGQVSLYGLAWIVNALVVVVQALARGAWELGKIAFKGLKEGWSFFRGLYERVLKPAWLKFWRVVDWARDTLDDFFRPIFKFLRTLRDELLKFYDKWVRPILDTIGIARKVLSVFRALGIEWAKKLDAKLASLEEAIDRPFRALLGKLNEVINFVNRIATADGLFQRLALVRSIARDFKVIGDEYARLHKKPISEAEQRELSKRTYPAIEPRAIRVEVGKFYKGEGGEFAGIINELIPEWRRAAAGSSG